MLKIQLIGPQNMVGDCIIATHGELKKGKSIDPHTNRGTEFAYIVEGKCEFKLDGKSYLLKAGDSFSFDPKLEHSLSAIEKTRFFGIYLKDKE
jgi:quercetin dioxygenase-like cupin family protein